MSSAKLCAMDSPRTSPVYANAVMKGVERGFFALFLFLQAILLWKQWGHIQGFDAGAYLEVFDHTHFFQPLPGVREFFYSYHPPLSHFLQRIIFFLYPNREISSQILSFLAVTGAVVLLRALLKHCGLLWSLPGVCFLYIAASLPVYIFLSTASSHDPLVFFWAVLTLALSVRIFWKTPAQIQKPREEKRKQIGYSLLLIMTIAASLFTKFTGLLNIALPFIVIAVRYPPREIIKKGSLAFLLSSVALAMVGPFYYQRYYQSEGKFFPSPMEWIMTGTLKARWAERDADPAGFTLRMLRWPGEPLWGMGTPVVQDSFFHSFWMHLWKRDTILGPQMQFSSLLSDVYIGFFFGIFVSGTVLFFTLHSRRPKNWNHLGWILLCVALLFHGVMVAYAFEYPVWEWRIFKVNFIAFAMLWIPFCAAIILYHVLDITRSRLRYVLQWVAIFAVAEFMIFNHLLPVY